MSAADRSMEEILLALQERAKELSCLYRVDEILNRPELDRDDGLREILKAIPAGWQYPHSCSAKLVLDGRVYQPPEWRITPWQMSAPIVLQGEKIGELTVTYLERFPGSDEGAFLKEERRLLNAIVERIGYSILQRRLRRAVSSWRTAVEEGEGGARGREGGERWDVILEFLRSTDRRLLMRLTRRMINHLCVQGVEAAERLLQEFTPDTRALDVPGPDDNQPAERRPLRDTDELTEAAFRLASKELSEDEVVDCIQNWIREDKSSFLYETLENLDTPISEISDAIVRYRSLNLDEGALPLAVRTGLQVALLRRFFSDQLEFINHAKNFVEVNDFYDLAQHIICSPRGHGKLGGKTAGLFVASNVVRKSKEYASLLGDIKVPRTWYITSDALLQFIRYNNMEDIYNRKYREIDQIRLEYPHLVQVFKNSPFPPEIVKGLSVALDDFEARPIIVRSSSLLEDRTGAAFSGKYKSLFLANQGTKKQRLDALQDAIAEVYASIFGPDPIEYRAERGLLDVHEEMGVMIQEVVGDRVGPYFLPAFSGVAFCNNEFRWSARIKREDGLVRIVPGLGTRAVDRVGDDYPTLIAPGQPGLRVNVTVDEIMRYSPRRADVINLETNAFETVEVQDLLRSHGADYPLVRRIVSVLDHDHMRKPIGLGPDFEHDELVVTFQGLFEDTSFIARIRALLKLLAEKLGTPVDVEFASDGNDFYLLQCRPQSYSEHSAPAPIPRDLPRDRIVFSATRYVSNGRVPDVTHIVYVDPAGYEALGERDELKAIGRIVGRLNTLLPKRQFVLMGPGRWGSRGDIRLGVGVTYSDINNTSMLIEIARAKGKYTPDLSFGTHFFQDLVEAGIRYLPLYPDDEGNLFNERFLLRSENIQAELLPDYARFAEVVRVIDVPRSTGGKIVRVLLNADLDEAVAVISEPTAIKESGEARERAMIEPTPEDHWRWRFRMAERIAAQIDGARFGVRGFYVFGSTKNATAGPGSDLDVIVHVVADENQRRELESWLEGWSLALAEMNYLRTGYRAERMLDVHYVTDGDVEQQTSYAAKIGAITDAARPLPLKG